MNTSSPLEVVTQLVKAMNQGDLNTALSLYEPRASLVVKPGVIATGTAALREALVGFVILKPTLTTEAQQVIETGDLALYCSRWNMRGTDPAGNSVHLSGHSSDVLRRQPDGNWRIALDNPYGPAIIG